MNFVELLLSSGFIPNRKVNPKDNWFGCSTLFAEGYSPDLILKRTDKEVILSLQGLAMRMDSDIFVRYKKLLDTCSVKYLGFYSDEKPVYESWSGEIPDIEFINNYIK